MIINIDSARIAPFVSGNIEVRDEGFGAAALRILLTDGNEIIFNFDTENDLNAWTNRLVQKVRGL